MPPRRKASGLKKKTGTKVKKAEVQLPTDAAQLAEVLGMMAVPDNDILAQAVRILRKFIETPACVPALMQQLTESPSAHTRQLSAILLHKRMRTHWPRLTPDLRSMIRSALLSCLPIEENRNVRNSTVGVISSIAQHDLKNKLQDEWPELIPFVFQGTSSADIKVQESCMFLLTRLVKRASSALEPHAATVKNTCLQLISSTEPRVRNYAIKGVDIAFSRYLEADEIGLITQVVAALITLVPTLIEENDDNSLMSVFSVFYNSSGPMIPITDEALTQIWTIMNTLMVDAEADMRYRAMAATLCVQILRARPGVITRLNLAAPLVQTIAQIVVEFAHDVFDSEQETTPQSMALDLIMPMMATLPQDQVFTAFLPCIMQYLISEHELDRKGGLVLLASLSNGCTDVMLEYEQGRAAAELARHAVSLLSDPSVTVRTAACLMICNNAESLSSILVPMHAEIMQRLLSILANPAEDSLVHRKCCMALEAFTNELGEDLNAYADAIIGEVQRVFATTNLEMHVMMISVLRSVADVMGKAFLPHFAPMMAIVRVWLTRDEEEFITIRARATECIGHMASAVGVVNWDDSVPLLFKFVIEGFTIDDSTLHDLSFVFMRKIVEAWGANTPKELVTPMLQLALAQINSSDGFDIDEGDEEEGNIAGLSDSSSDDDEADTDPAMSAIKKLAKPGSLEDGEGNEDEAVDDYTPFDTDDLRCNVPALEAKLEAFRLVQQSLTSLGDGFENDILEDLLNASLEIMHMPFAPLRTVIVETFGILVEWLRNNHPLEDKWVKGTVTPLPETHASLVDAIRDAMCETIIVDTEPSVVAAAMGTYGLLLDVYGMAMLPENDPEDEEEGQVLRDLFIVLGDMAKEDSGCQVDKAHNDIGSTNNLTVIEAYCNLLSALVRCMGGELLPFFNQIFGPMTEFTDPRRIINFRTGVLGTIADLVEHLGPQQHEHGLELVRLGLTFLNDASLDMQRHAAYLIGVIVINTATNYITPQQLTEAVANIAGIIPRALAVPAATPDRKDLIVQAAGAADNAVAALVKITALQSALVPLDAVMAALLPNLAFRDDWQEMNNTIPYLPKLWEAAPSHCADAMPQIIFAVANYFASSELSVNNRALLRQWVFHIGQLCPGQVEAIAAQLDGELQQALMTNLEVATA